MLAAAQNTPAEEPRAKTVRGEGGATEPTTASDTVAMVSDKNDAGAEELDSILADLEESIQKMITDAEKDQRRATSAESDKLSELKDAAQIGFLVQSPLGWQFTREMSENTDYNALKGKGRLATEFKKRWLRAKRAAPPLPLAHDGVQTRRRVERAVSLASVDPPRGGRQGRRGGGGGHQALHGKVHPHGCAVGEEEQPIWPIRLLGPRRGVGCVASLVDVARKMELPSRRFVAGNWV